MTDFIILWIVLIASLLFLPIAQSISIGYNLRQAKKDTEEANRILKTITKER